MISTASAVPRAPALNRGASWNRAPSGRQQSLDSQPTAPSPLAISRWRRGNHANQDRATVGNVVRCRAGLGFGKRLGKASLKKRDTCPCGSEKAYKECCERYHRGEAVEPDAEALMRARWMAPSALSLSTWR